MTTKQAHGQWRTAITKESFCVDRKAKNMDGSPYNAGCEQVIKIGRRYFDTGERGSAPWATLKLCESCALKQGGSK